MCTFNPIIITQILEAQCVYLTFPTGLNTIDFNNKIWGNYPQKSTNNSIVRIFEYNNNIHLAYYWKSTLEEPSSGRHGLVTFIAVHGSIKEFKTNKRLLAQKLHNLLVSIAEITNISNMETSDEFLRCLWDLAIKINYNSYDMEKIDELIQLIVNNSKLKSDENIDENLLNFIDAQKISLFKKLDAAIPLTISNLTENKKL